MDVKEIINEVFAKCRSPSTTGDRLLLHPKDREERPELWAAVQENQRGIVAELKRMMLSFT